jgi:uncharacterized protein YciI
MSTQPKVYYVVSFVISCASLDEVIVKAPDALAAHRKRSQEWHDRGTLLMAGAFLNNQGENLQSMGVLTTREAAEEFARGDPFVLNGMVSKWDIREWANMFA